MQISEIDTDFLNYTNTLGTVALRKLARELGLKGMSSARGEIIRLAIREAYAAHKVEAERAELAAETARRNAEAERVTVPGTKITAAVPAKRGMCTECGRKEDFSASGLCKACREYGEWENAHSDENHGEGREIEGCPVCYPELDPRKPVAKREGRSRAGMVIVAKGSEIHKSLVLKAAAEAIGWTVEIERETYELPSDATGEGTRYYATATRGEDSISLAWDGRAYDYPASSARINGKDRKVRNLKEALRLLSA